MLAILIIAAYTTADIFISELYIVHLFMHCVSARVVYKYLDIPCHLTTLMFSVDMNCLVGNWQEQYYDNRIIRQCA